MKNLKKNLIIIFLLTLLGFGAGMAVSYAQLGGEDIIALLSGTMTLVMTAIGFCGGIILALTMKPKKKESKKNKGETVAGEKVDIAFDATFMDPKSIKNNKDLISTTWNQLPSLQKTGFPFRFKQNGNQYEIAMKEENHCLVIGTTGTGKTQILANPTIRILAHSGEKPSIVMTDPKGELFRDNANILKKEGYKIVVLDLNDPYSSSKWNPMEPAFDIYQRATNLSKEVKKFSNCTPEAMGYKKMSEDEVDGVPYGDTWYGFDNKAFPNNETLKRELEAKRKQLETQAKDVIKNIAYSIIPIPTDGKDPVWIQGSQAFIQGIMEAMLEDSRYPELGMTKEKFNFFNLYKIALQRDQAMGQNDSQIKTLTLYSEGRDPLTSNVPSLMSAVCGASPVTQRSFLATLASSINTLLGDDGILYMTSGTDINFRDLVDRPTAFFIKAPDHKAERHPLAVLCVTQLYKALVDIAESEINPKTGKVGTLKRQIFMILDEFGNMPAFEKFGQMVTVSRSRGIRIEIILQSYKQLDIKYGAEEAQNIKGNFQTEIFLGSEDASTIQAFSEACGETTVFHDEESESKSDKGDQGKTVSKSTQRTRRPLIDKAELRMLPKWTVIAKIFRQPVLKEVMTPFFQTNCMEKNQASSPVSISQTLNEKEIFYDIEKRNKLFIKPKNPFGF